MVTMVAIGATLAGPAWGRRGAAAFRVTDSDGGAAGVETLPMR